MEHDVNKRRRNILIVVIVLICAVAAVLITIALVRRNSTPNEPALSDAKEESNGSDESAETELKIAEASEVDPAPGVTEDPAAQENNSESESLSAESKVENITFETADGSSEGMGVAVVTAADANGNTVWQYQSPEYNTLVELSVFTDLGRLDDAYYLIENGTVVALDAETGDVLWKNDDFNGSPALDAWAFGDDGLFLTGYYGPAFYLVSYDGKTQGRIEKFADLNDVTEVNLWPYQVEPGDGYALVYYGDDSPVVENPTIYRVDLDTWEYSPVSSVANETSGSTDFSMSHVISVEASSYLYESQYDISHDPDNVIDGSLSNAWCEERADQGIGSWIELIFDGTYKISGMKIDAGYQKSEDLYYKNSRPKEIRINFSDKSYQDYTLRDVMEQQTISFTQPVNTSNVTITIMSVYPGNKYQDTVISEISLY